MFPGLPSSMAEIQLYNYTDLVILTAIIYDYVLTFPQEIDYVWNRPWTLVSSMFIIVRYIGMAVFVIRGLFGSRFIPGPPVVSTVLLLVSIWGFVLFLAAADLAMILRVYAMYGQSKIVLGVLLVFYVSTIILFFVSAGYYNNPSTYMTMGIAKLFDMSIFIPSHSYPSGTLGTYKAVPRLTLAGLLLLLVVGRLCWESYHAYKVIRQWQVNRYMNLLVKEGILYFVVHIVYNINFGHSYAGVITTTIMSTLICVLSPRFIMNLRELYLRGVLWHCASVGGPNAAWDHRDMGIDAAFGISKSSFPQLQFARVDAEVEEDLVLPVPSFVVADSERFGISEVERHSERDIETQGFDEGRSTSRG